jgi:hypothetical protein
MRTAEKEDDDDDDDDDVRDSFTRTAWPSRDDIGVSSADPLESLSCQAPLSELCCRWGLSVASTDSTSRSSLSSVAATRGLGVQRTVGDGDGASVVAMDTKFVARSYKEDPPTLVFACSLTLSCSSCATSRFPLSSLALIALAARSGDDSMRATRHDSNVSCASDKTPVFISLQLTAITAPALSSLRGQWSRI